MKSVPARRDFSNARSNAKRRGKIWTLTFEQWSRCWERSGKYHLRGRKKGDYQMDRRNNQRGYVAGNVQIVMGRVNRTKDSPHGWRPKLTEQKVKAIRKAYQPRHITKPQLAAKYKVTLACIKAVLAYKNWRFV